jgi:hypothetical protein
LIDKGATVYDTDTLWQSIHEINLKNMKIKNGRLDGDLGDLGLKGAMCSCSIPLEDLFETKEDAEEYAEFGDITRMERLELPSWASIKKDFDKFTNGSYVLAERDEFSLELKISKPLISQIIIYTEDDNYNWNLSRENYNQARRLCVKLFKGDEV